MLTIGNIKDVRCDARGVLTEGFDGFLKSGLVDIGQLKPCTCLSKPSRNCPAYPRRRTGDESVPPPLGSAARLHRAFRQAFSSLNWFRGRPNERHTAASRVAQQFYSDHDRARRLCPLPRGAPSPHPSGGRCSDWLAGLGLHFGYQKSVPLSKKPGIPDAIAVSEKATTSARKSEMTEIAIACTIPVFPIERIADTMIT